MTQPHSANNELVYLREELDLVSDQRDRIAAEADRCHEALERIMRAEHMPYRSFKSYVLSESRKALLDG